MFKSKCKIETQSIINIAEYIKLLHNFYKNKIKNHYFIAPSVIPLIMYF